MCVGVSESASKNVPNYVCKCVQNVAKIRCESAGKSVSVSACESNLKLHAFECAFKRVYESVRK